MAFGRAAIVSANGGPVLHPARGAAHTQRSWAWSPKRDELAVVTRLGGVVLAEPGGGVRRVRGDGWGAREVSFARNGGLTVTRAVRSRRRGWTQQYVERRFGEESRSIWLLAAAGSRRLKLTAPPSGSTDELPRWSRNGRVLFFIRSGGVSRSATARGTLFVLGVTDRRVVGPLLELGPTWNYYGHYDWSDWADLSTA